MAKEYRITTYDSLVLAFREISQFRVESERNGKKALKLSVAGETEARKLSQNRLYYKWLCEISNQSGNGVAYERGFYKWEIGCMILARDDAWFGENIYEKLKESYSYEQAIDVMSKSVIQVSSLMSVKQMSEYLNLINESCIERGINVTTTDDMYFEAVYGAKKNER